MAANPINCGCNLFFPPVAIAVIAAYFTAPLLTAFHSVTKIPLTISTICVISILLFISGAFIYIGLHGIIDIVPTVERQLAPFTNNTDFREQNAYFS